MNKYNIIVTTITGVKIYEIYADTKIKAYSKLIFEEELEDILKIGLNF